MTGLPPSPNLSPLRGERRKSSRLPLRRASGGEGGAHRVSDGRVRWLAALLLVVLFAFPAHAVEPSEILKDPALEARARDIGRQLRCVVCQNQAIDDSNAEVAAVMRRAVRERLSAGDSDAQVFDYMVARYGDYVLLKPPFKPATLVLWLGAPLVLLLAGGALLFAARRRVRVETAPRPLTEAEKARLDSLLGARQSTGASSDAGNAKTARLESRAPSEER